MPTKIDRPHHEIATEAMERKLAGANAEIKDLRRSVIVARNQIDEWREKFDDLLAIRQPIKTGPLVRVQKGEYNGVAMAQWSDWHFAEKIESKKVNGLNKFSPEIARKRAHHCAHSTLSLFKHVRKSYNVDSMVLVLGGDFITGYLHEELVATNYMGPVEEGIEAQKLLAECLSVVASEKSLRKLRVVCHRGNHGRTTKKMQFKNDFSTSYETWIYANLADKFADNKRIVFEIPESDVHYTEIFPSWSLRTYHGHQVKFGDGIGGLTIPLNKWQARQDITMKADFNFMGHYHYYSEPNGRTSLNGSLKGYDEYAASHGFPWQPPLQSFNLLDTGRRMIAQRMPIFCE